MNLAPLQLAPMYATPENGGTGPNSFWPEKPDNKTAVSYRMWDQVTAVNEVLEYKTAYEAAIAKRYPGAKLATMDVYGLVSIRSYFHSLSEHRMRKLTGRKS